ncbi:MAG: sialidase family protein [Candidatus Hydrogenedentales bacterium]|jgi:hypothetical protein
MAAQAGMGFLPPAALNTNAVTDSGLDEQPQIATDSLGHWVAVWDSNDTLGGTIGSEQDILFSRSTDNGATWTAPAALNTNAATDTGNDTGPQITTDGLGNWVSVWLSNDSLGGTIGSDNDILVSRSTNNGATWSAPAALNTNAASDTGNDRSPQVTTDAAGHWVAVWYSTDTLGGTIGTDADILVSRSTNNGATWSAPAALNSNAATDSGFDQLPQVTSDGTGHWVAVWISDDTLGGTIDTDADILVSRSTNNGATWSAPAALNTNAASDLGTDDRPDVTTDGAGHWLAVWTSDDALGGTIGTDSDVLFARSTNNGATWSAPAALNANAATDSGSDYMPQVTTDGAGRWVAVWHSSDTLGGTLGTDLDILVSRSTDNGAAWSAPVALDSTAATDTGIDDRSQTATDGAGHWVATWRSNEPLGVPYGTDSDIMFSTMDRATDTDGDGIDDMSETNTGTYVDSWDTGSDPSLTDTDIDSLPDGWEVSYTLDPNDDGSGDLDNGPLGDPDGDGFSNWEEYDRNSDPRDPNSVPLPALGLMGLMAAGVALAGIGLTSLRRRR